MADYPTLPLWTDAYIADTQHLTNEEHGVYLRLLMFAWRTPECALPDDDRRLAIMVGVTPKKWAALKPAVMAFWNLSDGFWRQKKLTSERAFVERQREQKSAAGKASAEAKALKNNDAAPTAVSGPLPTADPTARQQPIPTPTPSKGKEEPTGSSKKRGTRLPAGWEPDRAFAKQEGLSDAQIDREAAKFSDYWRSQAGQKGVKLDWTLTWKNWVRRVADARGRGSGAVSNDWRDEPAYRGIQ